ncbi:hypothetical protein WA538_002328 [Blastocystis sp. DL]
MSEKTFIKLGGTQNKAWVESSSKSFGMKMMKMMGWKEGEGLGKDGDGQQTHIQMRKRPENQGLGVSENENNKVFISTIDNFNDVLQNLKKEHSNEIEKMKKAEKKLKKKEKKQKEKKEKKHHKPKVTHKYQKILKNKTVSNYSAEDLNAILGISPITDDSS